MLIPPVPYHPFFQFSSAQFRIIPTFHSHSSRPLFIPFFLILPVTYSSLLFTFHPSHSLFIPTFYFSSLPLFIPTFHFSSLPSLIYLYIYSYSVAKSCPIPLNFHPFCSFLTHSNIIKIQFFFSSILFLRVHVHLSSIIKSLPTPFCFIPKGSESLPQTLIF